MKLVRVEKLTPEGRVFVFQLIKQERECLLSVLGFYPQLDLYIQPISRQGEVNPESQRLLEEAMAEQRQARQTKLREFIKNGPRLKRDADGRYRLMLNGEDLEWLLQVLNEIRVGCWILLGRPEADDLSKRRLIPDEMRACTMMDLCGYFQAELLSAAHQ